MAEIKFRELKYNKARLAIMKFIAESGLKVGDRLPSERELVKRLPCSSITMRHALADMEAAGLIDRRHGSGNYLAREIRNDQFQNNILFVFVFQKEEDLPGWGIDRLRFFLADRGLGLSYVAVSEFGLEVVNASRNCIGIITGGSLTEDFLLQLKTLGLPIVVQGNSGVTLDLPVISVDLELAAYRLARIMIEDGRKQIALFRGPDDYHPAVQAEAGYRRALREDVDGILMEHSSLPDFLSWVWRTSYNRKPAIGFLSKESDHKKYRQNRNFLWIKFPRLSLLAGQVLLDSIIEGKPMHSIKVPPFIPSIDDDNDSFIS